jgi:tRNA pseudouridine55 synthase
MSSSLHGLLLINKDSGMTSHDVVARLRRILQMKAIGHSGTLDPLASGLMVMLLGEATKLSQYILEKNKAYIVRAQLGVETDSFDMTGKVVKTSDQKLSREKIRQAVLDLQGSMELEVPIFSATKVDGKKLYEYARAEAQVQIPKKSMRFYDVQVLEQGEDWVDVSLSCSKGAFIRSWVQLLGQNLGIGASVAKLQRTVSEPYFLDQAISLQELEQSPHPQAHSAFIPMSGVLPQQRIIRVQGQDQVMIGNGLISHQLKNQLIAAYNPEASNDETQVIKILSQKQGELLALIGLDPEKGFTIRRVFRY